MTVSPRWRRAGRVLYWVGLAALAVVLYRRVAPSIELSGEAPAAPPVEAALLDGAAFRLADYRGRVVVLNFWATWCPPCLAEIPGFVRLQEELRDDGVVFVGVAMDEGGAAAVAPFAERHGITYPLVLDDGALAARFGGVAALPTTLLIDRAGRVRYRHEGLLLAHALRPALDDLAREPAPR
jgi:peroxiredoxin